MQIYNSLVIVGGIMTFFMSLSNVGMVGILRAGGDAKFVFIADVAFLWLVAIPLGFITGLGLPLSLIHI